MSAALNPGAGSGHLEHATQQWPPPECLTESKAVDPRGRRRRAREQPGPKDAVELLAADPLCEPLELERAPEPVAVAVDPLPRHAVEVARADTVAQRLERLAGPGMPS